MRAANDYRTEAAPAIHHRAAPIRATVSATLLAALLAGCTGGTPPASGPSAADADATPSSEPTSLAFTLGQEQAATGVVTYAEGGSITATADDGTTFALSPGDEPTTMTAVIVATGGDRTTETAPIEPADGSIGDCGELP